MNSIQFSKIINGRILFVVPKGAFKCFFFGGGAFGNLFHTVDGCEILRHLIGGKHPFNHPVGSAIHGGS